jgi:hypothetical protein
LQVRSAAEKIAQANMALEALPPAQRPVAMDLAELLKSTSVSLGRAAELAAKNSHRLHYMANAALQKVDDTQPLDTEQSTAALRTVAALTKMANDAASTPINLLAANKETVKELNMPKPEDEPSAPLRPQVSREEWLKIHGHA